MSGIYKGSNIYFKMSMEIPHTLLFRKSRKTRATASETNKTQGPGRRRVQ